MSLIDRIRGVYNIKVKCENCEKECEVKIKKGTKVQEALDKGQIICDYCLCEINPETYTTEWNKT